MAKQLFACFCVATLTIAAREPSRITLPIEVTGQDGVTESVSVDVAAKFVDQILDFKMQIHGVQYRDMVSIRINLNGWIPLNNDTVSVGEPAKSYGGIGGGITTLKLTLRISPHTLIEGSNTIQFRFNHTNGVVSGFRVLGFNFLTVDRQAVLSTDVFQEEDPNRWLPPLPEANDIATGHTLWQAAQLAANGLPNAPPIRAHCSDCHTQDGRDLKYFNFSNASIIARSRFHGLSERQGQQIASYIRSLPFPNPGRPWNPPYQPGPGLDSQPVASWSAGAGLQWVLDNDADSLPFIFGKDRNGTALISSAAFAPDANLNPREIPIALPLPDWNHWLPHVHPLDTWGSRFSDSTFSKFYDSSADASDSATFFDRWAKSRNQFLRTPKKWSPELTEAFYSAELWQLVKTWEISQKSNLEMQRTWPNVIAEGTAPASVNIPDGTNGMGGSTLTNEYFNSAWYQLQVVVNSGGHRHQGKLPLDWIYLTGRFLDLQQISNRPEPARLLITVIKALQSTDPKLGPNDIAEGWRPERNIDPRIMVDKDWTPVFSSLPAGTRRALTEAFLTAWLDKNLSYLPVSYFQRGLSASSYAPPVELRNVSGGKAWLAAPQFQAAGVNAQAIQRLQNWGDKYSSLAQLFHY